jgi:2-iminobutanoate/2-iminopropanoate deaminase
VAFVTQDRGCARRLILASLNNSITGAFHDEDSEVVAVCGMRDGPGTGVRGFLGQARHCPEPAHGDHPSSGLQQERVHAVRAGDQDQERKILWLAGTTALPVYHDHPHKRDEIQQYMTNDLEAQTRRAMDGIKQTLEASGASFKDVVHIFVLRARPRMGDIGKASAVINSYFAPFNHKPTSTNVAVLELGEPEQLIEIQVVAVVD